MGKKSVKNKVIFMSNFCHTAYHNLGNSIFLLSLINQGAPLGLFNPYLVLIL